MSESFNKINNINNINCNKLECNTNTKLDKGQIQELVPKILDAISKIAIEKLNPLPNKDYIQNIINEFHNCQKRKPFIMNYDDFDKEEFYDYICKVSVYYLLNINAPTTLQKVVLKNLIDLSKILIIILKDRNNYNNVDVKLSIYHCINIMSNDSNKIESSSNFFKICANKLRTNYGVNNFNEYFPEQEKVNNKNGLLDLVVKVLNKINEEFIFKAEKNQKYLNALDEITLIVKEVKHLKDKSIINFNLNEFKQIMNRIIKINWDLVEKPYFDCLSYILSSFKRNIPDDVDGFFYSLNYINIKKDIFKYFDNSDDYLIESDLVKQFMDDLIIKEMQTIIIKFKKYLKIEKISKGNDSFEKEFKDIIKTNNFRNKIRDFYKSQKIKTFINIYVDEIEKDKVLKNLPKLNEMLETEDFWDKIYFCPLSKYKKAYLANFLRIIVNCSFIKLKSFNNEEKVEILTFLLFEILIHEIFHLLRRLGYTGNDSALSLTPPNDNDIKNNNITGEIGERLIFYFFKISKIQKIIYEQAAYFAKLNLKVEEDIEKLKNIFEIESKKKLNECSYAKFNETEKEREILFEIHDCRKYIYIPPFDYN